MTEFADLTAIRVAARTAARELGYTRMWSIHPAQIRPILEAFSPDERALSVATEIIASAALADWSPIQFDGQLQDRASYRYHWQVLERAHRTGQQLPEPIRHFFEDDPAAYQSAPVAALQ